MMMHRFAAALLLLAAQTALAEENWIVLGKLVREGDCVRQCTDDTA